MLPQPCCMSLDPTPAEVQVVLLLYLAPLIYFPLTIPFHPSVPSFLVVVWRCFFHPFRLWAFFREPFIFCFKQRIGLDDLEGLLPTLCFYNCFQFAVNHVVNSFAKKQYINIPNSNCSGSAIWLSTMLAPKQRGEQARPSTWQVTIMTQWVNHQGSHGSWSQFRTSGPLGNCKVCGLHRMTPLRVTSKWLPTKLFYKNKIWIKMIKTNCGGMPLPHLLCLQRWDEGQCRLHGNPQSEGVTLTLVMPLLWTHSCFCLTNL